MEFAAIIALLTVIPVGLIYNRLVRSRQKIIAASKLLQSNLQNRAAYLERLPGLVPQQVPAGGSPVAVSGNPKNFIEYVKNNPELHNNPAWLSAQRTLFELEERVDAALRTYNAAAKSYNTYMDGFPHSSIADAFGFEKAPYAVDPAQITDSNSEVL